MCLLCHSFDSWGSKSRTIEDIVKEAEYLASVGVKELTLIAQDTTKYGLDNYGTYKLGDLIRAIDKIPGFHWISYPLYVSR